MILSLLCVKFAVEPHTSASRNFKLEFLQGLNYVRQTPLIRRMIFLATSVSAVGTFHLSLMPAIAKDLLGLQEVGYGQTAGSMGLGSVLAALVIIVTAHQPIKKYLFPASMFALTAALFALSITKTPWLAWTFIGLTGFCFVIATLICRKTIQLNAPQELLGRIVGIEVWAMIGSTGIGFPIFGWLAQRYSLAFTFQIAAVILLLCSLSWFYRKSDFASIDAMS
jgi:MFS family permease